MPLFDIIKSMSAAEKRHFKLYAGSSRKDKSHKYVKLFDMINKQPKSDESAVEKAGFKPMDKNLLQEKIEESLHVQYLGKHVDSKLKWLLESMPRLYERKLWNELRKCIKKTRQLAEKHERFWDALQAVQWEKKLLFESRGSKNLYERYDRLIGEETELRRKQDEEMNCYNLRIRIDMLRLKDIALSKPENRAKFEEITNSSLVQNKIIPSSTKAQINYFHFKSVVSLYNKKPMEAYQYAQSLVDVFENNTSFKSQHLSWYKSSLCVFSQICHFSSQTKQIPAIIDKIEKIDGIGKDGFKTVCVYGLLYAIANLDKQRGEEYIIKIQALIKEDKGDVRDGVKLTLFYNTLVFYSYFDEWQKSKEWLSKILTYKRTDDRRDLQYAARILSLMNHYELESDDMDNHIQAIAKYLKTNQQYTETNHYILQAFRDLYKAINRKERLTIWENFDNYLTQKKQEQTLAPHQLGLEELQIWCKAKINNTTIAEIIRKKNLK